MSRAGLQVYEKRTETEQKQICAHILEAANAAERKRRSKDASTHGSECGWWGFFGGATEFHCSTGFDVMHIMVILEHVFGLSDLRLVSPCIPGPPASTQACSASCCHSQMLLRHSCHYFQPQKYNEFPTLFPVLQELGIWLYILKNLKDFIITSGGNAKDLMEEVNVRCASIAKPCCDTESLRMDKWNASFRLGLVS